ncbi:MAG: 6-phosphofructokinase [Candidatus Omnitrophica bacterium]|nr:6-phosphofructokinase [Candidatus Omnitrophota bacterium]
MKKIGVLCSGGDGPGMNAAVRAVVRAGCSYGLKIEGIMRGYQGLIENDLIEMGPRSVSGIIGRGGTIIKTARSSEFRAEAGQKKALATLKRHKIDALVVVGGDGSYLGANALYQTWGFPTVGIPGTIDNDLYGTDQTIGCNTAINTALEAIDKVRDTAHSMERIFIVEVMGNRSGHIAMQVALGAGAEDVVIPEFKPDYKAMCDRIMKGAKKGKISWIIVVSEGVVKAEALSSTITNMTGLETRSVVLGHVQRGGNPCALDRNISTRLGVAAVEQILEGNYGKAIGVIQDKINIISLAEARKRPFEEYKEYYRLISMLR